MERFSTLFYLYNTVMLIKENVSIFEIPGVRSVAISAMVKAGSWYEKGRDWGLAHLAEHMFFKEP